MRRISPRFVPLLAGALLGWPLLGLTAEPAMEKNGMLVDQNGMTLYTYDKDADGKSTCNGQCAQNWPPLMADATAKAEGEWSVVKRDDGSMQWAYDGKPVYTFIMDKKAGDVTGDGKMGVWHIVKPEAY
ncbi:COG4315 family predicted lipoprotein [Pseudomonas sp. OTU5201]|uniref:COG4315 family predicted lipoprotein n=1 Tax=Pseudomonas sp. OTU5201 TaxID=3043850 RepID=UPI00313CACC8